MNFQGRQLYQICFPSSEKGPALKGKNLLPLGANSLLPKGANSFLLE